MNEFEDIDNEALGEDWSDENKPQAFSGVSIFSKSSNLPQNLVKNKILPSIPTYQKYRTAKKPRIYNPYFVRTKRKVFQSDLLFMRNPTAIDKNISMNRMIKDNNGFQYILIVQDVFSRKIWATPLKRKDKETVIEALKNIFNQLQPFHKDARLIVDRGSEYLNNNVRNYMNRIGVSISHSSTGHAAHVERANLSLQRLLYTNIAHENNQKAQWIRFLEKAVRIMNNRYHRIIKMSPNEAEMDINKNKVNEAMAIYRHKAIIKEQTKSFKKKQSRFQVGDHVRLYKYRTLFSRGYSRNFTTEVYEIKTILGHLPITMYMLQDLDGEEIDGNFYPEELSLVTGNVFKVERIIRRALINGRRMIFVKWEGYPDSYNSWVGAENYTN